MACYKPTNLVRNAACIFLLGLFSLVSVPVAAQSTSCNATASEFNAISIGMSVAQVERVIGCTGVILSESKIADFHTVMLMWSGRGMMGANMNVMFQNGNVVMKSQFGLQ